MTQGVTHLTKSGFDIHTAVLLAQAAELAYEVDATIVPIWAKYQGLGTATVFDRSNIQGYWTTSGNVAVLVFRGTSNIGQWIRNARLLPARHAWGLVHSGFFAGLADVDDVLQGFDQAAAQAEHVWVAGHSLGGALAVLAASRLQQQGIAATVYTYGQPRVGLGEFADRFGAELPARLWRFINQSDVVPRVPPSLLYRHCGQVKRIVRPGLLEAFGVSEQTAPELNDHDELPPLTDEECERLLDELDAHPALSVGLTQGLEGRFSVLSDHSMTEYVRLLTQLSQ